MSDAAAEGDLDRLLPLLERRGALLARLPRGQEQLGRIAELDKEIESRLRALRQQLLAELGQIQHGMRALEGYHTDTQADAQALDRLS